MNARLSMATQKELREATRELTSSPVLMYHQEVKKKIYKQQELGKLGTTKGCRSLLHIRNS
jgi:hypothetical protein